MEPGNQGMGEATAGTPLMASIYHVTDQGVIELTPLTGIKDLSLAVLQRSRDAAGDAWWDAYEERIKVDQVLMAGHFRARER